MTIDQDSDFALNLWLTFQNKRPRKVIETGTYLGTGTTALIASALEDIWGNEGYSAADFYSIELDEDSWKAARRNLSESKLDRYLHLYHGLTVPRELLPSVEEIQKRCVDELPAHIAVEHEPRERVFKYYAETAIGLEPTTQDDLLGLALECCGNKPDFVLLDSGGHMGLVEFEYLISRLQQPCTIMLDDVFHVKHHHSLNIMLDDLRFEVRCLSREKYGFVIADFTPAKG